MEDLDKVLKQKSTSHGRSSAKKARSRPRSMTREETKLSLSPAKGATGNGHSYKKKTLRSAHALMTKMFIFNVFFPRI